MRLQKGKKPMVTIGIMGQEAGMGATHLSIALACYLAEQCRERTALVELSGGGAFWQLSPLGNEDSFVKNKVQWFPALSPEELGEVYCGDYSYVVLDLGSDSRLARQELKRCHRRIIIGSLSPWRRERYYSCIKRMQEELGDIQMYTFVALFGDRIEIKHCRRTMRVQVKAVPFIADPFQVQEEVYPFFQSLLRG